MKMKFMCEFGFKFKLSAGTGRRTRRTQSLPWHPLAGAGRVTKDNQHIKASTATQARQRTSDTSRAAMQCPSGPQCVHGLDDIDGTPEGTASPLWIPTGSPLASHSFAQLRTASHWPEFLRSHWVPSGFR